MTFPDEQSNRSNGYRWDPHHCFSNSPELEIGSNTKTSPATGVSLINSSDVGCYDCLNCSIYSLTTTLTTTKGKEYII
jgi:hypothetical protein